jgi:hypothetical protein
MTILLTGKTDLMFYDEWMRDNFEAAGSPGGSWGSLQINMAVFEAQSGGYSKIAAAEDMLNQLLAMSPDDLQLAAQIGWNTKARQALLDSTDPAAGAAERAARDAAQQGAQDAAQRAAQEAAAAAAQAAQQAAQQASQPPPPPIPDHHH